MVLGTHVLLWLPDTPGADRNTPMPDGQGVYTENRDVHIPSCRPIMHWNRYKDGNGAALTVDAVIVTLSIIRTTASGLQDLSALAIRGLPS